jgi:hypothetical protein
MTTLKMLMAAPVNTIRPMGRPCRATDPGFAGAPRPDFAARPGKGIFDSGGIAVHLQYNSDSIGHGKESEKVAGP